MSDVPSDIAPLLVTPLNHDVVCYTVFTGVAEFFRLNGVRVRAAVVAQAFGVVASDLEDADADAEEITQRLDGGSDIPTLNLGNLPRCPACLQIRPPAARREESRTVPMAISESGDDSTAPVSNPGSDNMIAAADTVQGTPRVSVTTPTAIVGDAAQDVAEDDLTQPANAVLATVDALCCMPLSNKIILKTRLSAAHEYRNALSLEQSCALNIHDTVIPTYDTGAAYRPLTYVQFMTRNGPVVQEKIAAADRWYVVQVGLGFTGIVRGYNNYKNYVPKGVANVHGQVCSSREQAEMTWLLYFRRSDVATVQP